MKTSPSFRLLLFFVLISTIFILSFYPKTTLANSNGDSAGIKITKIDTSLLSANHPRITVWVDNQDAIDFDDLSLNLSYFVYPKINHGKPWEHFGQLDYSADFIRLEAATIKSIASGEVKAITFKLQPEEVAKLSQVPTIFTSELLHQGESLPVSYQVSIAIPRAVSMVHATALAFDNPHYSSGNLAPQIQETVNGVKTGSKVNTQVFSIILADDFGEDDTQTYFIYGGIIIPAQSIFPGLPNKDGILSNRLAEYDMGDGEVLGGYLKWIRQITNNHKLTFSFYGHGGALMPDISPQSSHSFESAGYSGSGPVTLPSWITIQPSWITIQPSWITIQPSWITIQSNDILSEQSFATDAHPASLISIKDLATALKKGSNDGRNPIAVVDLVHCFSLSIEEVYELAPYAETIIGSANYHFFDARMPGQALQDLNGNQPAERIATSIMTSYDQTLPIEGYPRTMAVIKSDAVADIKPYWDQTSAALLIAFSKDHEGTRNKLQQAYHASTKYDSTSCDNTFSLEAPDALIDFYELSNQIKSQFDDDLSIALPAKMTATQIDKAVVSVINRSGLPWYSTNDQDSWQFAGKGLSIYADLVGLPDEAGRYALSWQSAFYNRVPHEDNLTPFDFIASDNQQPTWADVIHKLWEGYEISAQGCVVSIPLDPDRSEVSISNVIQAEAKVSNTETKPVFLADIYLDHQLGNLIVQFEIIRSGEVIYSEEVYTGWLDPGAHTISTSEHIEFTLFSSVTGDEVVIVTLDPQGFIVEENKLDNQLTVTVLPTQ